MIYEPTAHTPRRQSPAVLFVGRQNSGKTTLLEKVIRCLTKRGLAIATLKHHGHPNFSIDVPGKDSYRHREAGAQSTVVLSSSRLALTRNLQEEMGLFDALALMTDYDLVLVEGFRGVGLPAIELLRAENPKDQIAAQALLGRLKAHANTKIVKGDTECSQCGKAISTNSVDGIQPNTQKDSSPRNPNSPELPTALVTDMNELACAAKEAHIPVFGYEDIEQLATFVQKRYARAPLTIAIQAGGESKRMGQSKARTPFLGRPLIEHMIDVTSGFADELIVTTNEINELSYLQDFYPGIRLVEDVTNKRGALPGLLTALESSTNELVGVVACDMIAFPAKLLSREALALQATQADAVLPLNEGYWEPFAGVYRKSTCKPAIKNIIATGSKRMRDLIDIIDCRAFNAKSWQRRGMIDPFANVNTPEELAQAEVLYRVYK